MDKLNGDLVALQTIRHVEGESKDYVDDMHVLLLLNLEAEGARFAALRDGEADLLVLTARVHPGNVARESVETMLLDSFRLSRRLDEVTGNAPAEAAEPAQTAPAPADWYPDPKGEQRLRYWDGSRWTEHTAA